MVGSQEKAPLLLSGKASRNTSAFASITPVDQYNAAYLSFLLLGAAFLFPWVRRTFIPKHGA